MRNYIITPVERKIILRFLETENHLEGFRMLLSRVKKLDVADLKEQIRLIEAFLAKAEG
jgi:hypothetical protein